MSSHAHADWDAAAARARLGIGAAELHGLLAGYLCAGWSGDARQLWNALELDAAGGPMPGPLVPLLGEAGATLSTRLRAGQPVVPLLPHGPLQARADALVEWCRGFLGGLGLTGALGEPGAAAPAVREWLDGLAQVAAAPLACEPGDEAALADVLDFVADGVAALHHALAPGAGR